MQQSLIAKLRCLKTMRTTNEMTATSFVPVVTYESIKDRIERRQIFCHEQCVNCCSNKITLRLSSRFIDEKTAHDIWHDHNYLVSFNIEYRGKIGIGGSGFAIDKFDCFATWDTFKAYINKLMKRFDGYDTEEYGQMCLF